MAAALGKRAAWRSLSAGVACLTGGMAVAVAPRPNLQHIAPALHCDEKTKATRAVARRGPCSDTNEVEETIGHGGFGIVRCARNRLTGTHRAVNIVRKDGVLMTQHCIKINKFQENLKRNDAME